MISGFQSENVTIIAYLSTQEVDFVTMVTCLTTQYERKLSVNHALFFDGLPRCDANQRIPSKL